MYDPISDEVKELQAAYEAHNVPRIQAAHGHLLSRGIELCVVSAVHFLGSTELTGEWSEEGTRGGLAGLKAVELANEFDPEMLVLPRLSRTYLLIWSALEFYRCGRHGMARAVLRRADAQIPEDIPRTPVVLFSQLVVALCEGNVGGLEHRANICVEEASKVLLSMGKSSKELLSMYAYLGTISASEGMLKLAEHLRTGTTNPLDEAARWLSDSSELVQQSGDTEMGLLAESLVRALGCLRKLSIWTAVHSIWPMEPKPSIVRQWVHHRIANSFPFLFPTQFDALVQDHVLNRQHALVSMPTGGGKSLLAEVATVKTLASDAESRIVVVVPSRALAAEKREDLGKAFGWDGSEIEVCQLTGDVAIDNQEAVNRHRILVMTPEKFDILLRQDFYGASIGLLIVDEFQLLRTQHRGIKLQLAISRFRHRRNAASLYISAIVRTADLAALSRWATSPDPFSTDWRPTPYRAGIVELDQQPWHVEFNDGTSRTITPEVPIRVNAKNKAAKEVVRDFLKRDQVMHFNLYWRGQGEQDNLLVSAAHEYASRMPDTPYLNTAVRDRLVGRMARLLGSEHEVTWAFSRGIAIHWSELPVVARRIVEEGIREKALALVIATSTLAEGVNLPIKTVFISKLATSHGPLEVGAFMNVAGRAGRPFFHSEGELVIGTCESGRADFQTPRSEAERYRSATRETVERMITSSVGLAAEVSEGVRAGYLSVGSGRPTESMNRELARVRSTRNQFARRAPVEAVPLILSDLEVFSASILALLVEGLVDQVVDNPELDEVLFLGTETDPEKMAVRNLLTTIQTHLIEQAAIASNSRAPEVTDWGSVIYQSGFGPESCGRLKAVLSRWSPDRNLELAKAGKVGNDREFVFAAAKLLREPYEAAQLFPDASFDSPAILCDWVTAADLGRISRRYPLFRNDYLTAFTRMERTSFFAAWVFFASQLIARHLFGDCATAGSFLRLAKASLYGHPDPRAQALLRQDSRRELLRDDVIALFETASQKEIEEILEGRCEERDIIRVLQKSKRTTRLPEETVASSIARISRSRQGQAVE